jgi:hypothetical protein
MIALDDVLTRLDGVRRTRRGYVARCPAHLDRHPSLSIRARDDGRGVLLHCFSRHCSYVAIVRALKLERAPRHDDGEAHSLDVHALALRIARSQRWADPLVRDVMKASRIVRLCWSRADTLRRRATAIGSTPVTWDALALAARDEIEALRVEHAIDEALR